MPSSASGGGGHPGEAANQLVLVDPDPDPDPEPAPDPDPEPEPESDPEPPEAVSFLVSVFVRPAVEGAVDAGLVAVDEPVVPVALEDAPAAPVDEDASSLVGVVLDEDALSFVGVVLSDVEAVSVLVAPVVSAVDGVVDSVSAVRAAAPVPVVDSVGRSEDSTVSGSAAGSAAEAAEASSVAGAVEAVVLAAVSPT